MNHVKLAHLINDIADGIERSRLEGIHCKDKDGNILRDCNGFPYYNMAAVSIMQSIIQAEIIKEAFKYES